MSLAKLTKPIIFASLCSLLSLGKLPGWISLPGSGTLRFQQKVNAQEQTTHSTFVTAHLYESIDSTDNLLWCATFQLAWNELSDLIGEDIHLEDEPVMVDYLNQKGFTKDQIDEASFLAMAGFVEDDIIQQINQAMEDQFPEADADLIPTGENLRPEDIVVYAYLFKSLHFPVPFERLDDPLNFQGTPVEAFGVGPQYSEEQDEMITQVTILDYQGVDDFIIELQTDAAQDRLILAKIQPSDTLQATIDQIDSRIEKSVPETIYSGDRLEIPLININTTRVYNEIMNLPLVVQNPEIAQDLEVLDARQIIRFEMDEKGVELESETTIALGCAASPENIPTHYLIFDKPFLVMMQRNDAEQPYFALWVNNIGVLAEK